MIHILSSWQSTCQFKTLFQIVPFCSPQTSVFVSDFYQNGLKMLQCIYSWCVYKQNILHINHIIVANIKVFYCSVFQKLKNIRNMQKISLIFPYYYIYIYRILNRNFLCIEKYPHPRNIAILFHNSIIYEPFGIYSILYRIS